MSRSLIRLSIIISVFLLKINSIRSTTIHKDLAHDDFRHEQNIIFNSMKTYLDEASPYERIVLLNEIREHLNRLCLDGFFGSSHAEACQHIADLLHRPSMNNKLNSNDENLDEQVRIQKRFFCNGFIGCKNAAG